MKREISRAVGGSAEVESKPRARLHVEIARQLGGAIVTGGYAPGDTLPGELDFAEQLNVSRSAYREAVRMLAAKGLVESRPKAGTKVRQRRDWNLLDPDLLAWMFDAEPSAHFVQDLFGLRLIVEPAAAELAARLRTASQLARLRDALEDMGRHGLATAAGQAADQDFHNIILEATDNELLVSLSSSIAAAVRWTTIFKQRKRKVPRDPMPEHRALYETIAGADPAAAHAAMRELVRLAREDTELSLES